MLKIHEKLQHLNQDQLQDLISSYYNESKTVKELIDEYNIDVTPSFLYKYFPPEELEDEFCEHCGNNMYKSRESKSSYGYSICTPYCINCGHKNIQTCDCKTCNEIRKYIAQDKRKKIIDCYSPDRYDIVDIEQLNFRKRVYLGTLVRYCLSEDTSHLLSLDEVDVELMPNDNSSEIVRHLFRERIISPYIYSDITAFEDNEEFPRSFYLNRVKYNLNIKYDIDKNDTLYKLKNPNMEIDIDEAFNMWSEIALNECLEYLNYQMGKVDFDFNPGDKTILVMKELLNDFSISQVFAIIHSAIRSASKYYLEKRVPKKQAANSVITNCENYRDRAILENWNIRHYSRPWDLPQSGLSEFLFNKVLKIGNKYLDEVISKDYLNTNIMNLD